MPISDEVARLTHALAAKAFATQSPMVQRLLNRDEFTLELMELLAERIERDYAFYSVNHILEHLIDQLDNLGYLYHER